MKFSLSILLASTLLFVGCAGTKSLGKIGNTEYFSVKSRSLFNPSVTLVVSQNETGQHVEASAAGSGPGIAFINAAGNVGSAAAFGLSLRPDRTQVNQAASTDATASSEAAASGTGSSSATGGPVTRVNGNSANAPGHTKP